MRKIYFVTRNEYKFKRFLDSTQGDNIEFERLVEETLEIQAYNNQVVSSFSAKWVADKMGLLTKVITSNLVNIC